MSMWLFWFNSWAWATTFKLCARPRARAPLLASSTARAQCTPPPSTWSLTWRLGGGDHMPGPPSRQQHTTPGAPVHDDRIISFVQSWTKARSPVVPPPWRGGSASGDSLMPTPAGPPPAPGGQAVYTPNDMRCKRSVNADPAVLRNLRDAPLLEDQGDVFFRNGHENHCAFRLRYNATSPMTVMYQDESGGKLWIGSEQNESLYNREDGITMRVNCICLGWCKGGARNCL